MAELEERVRNGEKVFTKSDQYWSMGELKPMPDGWRRKLERMPFARRSVCSQLLKTQRFKSLSRDAMKQQLIRWLSGTVKDASPFSDAEWKALGASSFRRSK